MSLENRLYRLENKIDTARPEDPGAPVSEEHRIVRERLEDVVEKFFSLVPPEVLRRRLSDEEEGLVDEYLDLKDAERRIINNRVGELA